MQDLAHLRYCPTGSKSLLFIRASTSTYYVHTALPYQMRSVLVNVTPTLRRWDNMYTTRHGMAWHGQAWPGHDMEEAL
jgi:hypothetical protein